MEAHRPVAYTLRLLSSVAAVYGPHVLPLLVGHAATCTICREAWLLRFPVLPGYLLGIWTTSGSSSVAAMWAVAAVVTATWILVASWLAGDTMYVLLVVAVMATGHAFILDVALQ